MSKKVIAVLLATTLPSLAFAASNVTLYGVVDTGVQALRAKTDDATVVRLHDGLAGGSRWGIRAVEDLGNGNSVGFRLEQGFKSDTGEQGASGLAFNRESTLYVSGDWGTATMGRAGALSSGTGTINLLKGTNFDPMNACYALIASYKQLMINTDRWNNLVAYKSPDFGGAQISLAYSNGADDTNSEWSVNSHYYGAGATYEAGDLRLVGIFEYFDNKGGTTNKSGVDMKNKSAYVGTFGGSYDFKSVKVFGGYQYAAQEDLRKQHVFMLGTNNRIGSGLLRVEAKYMFGTTEDKLREATEKDMNLWSIGTAYEYPLSKRTHWYTFGAYAHGGKALSSKEGVKKYNDYNSGSPLKGLSSVAGGGWVLATGLHHTF